MAASKSGFMKDALILFAITLVSGICLGFVYDVTKGPIEQATIAANNATYREVLSTAESFETAAGSEETIEATAEEFGTLGYGSVAIESVLEGRDASGNVVGYVINSLSKNSYGGAVKLSIGFDMDGTITGVGIREISDTPGLGLKAKEPAYRDQFIGKNADVLTVTKSGQAADNEINAISGATITSSATTNAVNAALYYLHNYMN
ncbi:RnfABCDGE type electron transport complex subunit G [Lachnospiraceae bacterium 45-P1]